MVHLEKKSAREKGAGTEESATGETNAMIARTPPLPMMLTPPLSTTASAERTMKKKTKR